MPISPETILKRQIRPALMKLEITKRVGYHTFRHTLATMRRQHGIVNWLAPVKDRRG